MGSATSDHDTKQYLLDVVQSIGTDDYMPLLNKAMDERALVALKSFIQGIGDALLDTQMEEGAARMASSAQFSQALERLWGYPQKFPARSFSVQLFQYYALVSKDDFDAKGSAEDFHHFLEAHKDTLGNGEHNLFIVEEMLARIHADFEKLKAIPNAQKASEATIKVHAQFLMDQMRGLSEKVMQWVKEAPDNAFVWSLSFASNFVGAEALDYSYNYPFEALTQAQKAFFSESRQYNLEAALEALRQIEILKQSTEAEEEKTLLGREFSLGRDVFYRMPIHNLETAKEQTKMLLDAIPRP